MGKEFWSWKGAENVLNSLLEKDAKNATNFQKWPYLHQKFTFLGVFPKMN
jgi:hypothetical protein